MSFTSSKGRQKRPISRGKKCGFRQKRELCSVGITRVGVVARLYNEIRVFEINHIYSKHTFLVKICN